MLQKLGLESLEGWLPLILAGVSAALFLFTFFLSRLARRLLRRRIASIEPGAEGFLGQFWRTEQAFVLKTVSWVLWLGFLAALFALWSGYLGKMLGNWHRVYALVARTAVIVIISLLALKAVDLLIRIVVEQITPLAERATSRGKQRVGTLNHIFRYGSTFLIVMVTALMLLDTFGIDLKAVLATVGVAGLAVGFGAQSLVKDVVSGIFILVEDQFAVGDVINVNGEGGLVERMTLRVTQLRNPEGVLITVPNGTIGMVKNLTSEWSRVDYMIGVAYDTDLDRALEVLMEEAQKLRQEMPEAITEEPEQIGVDAFGDSAVVLRIWIKTEPLKQWVVKRELNRRVHRRFEKEGIEIPFPQRTLWIRERQAEG